MGTQQHFGSEQAILSPSSCFKRSESARLTYKEQPDFQLFPFIVQDLRWKLSWKLYFPDFCQTDV